MADLIYRKVLHDLKDQITQGHFKNQRLPDERSLSESYGVSRSSIKRALSVLANQGIIFKKNVDLVPSLIHYIGRTSQFFIMKAQI